MAVSTFYPGSYGAIAPEGHAGSFVSKVGLLLAELPRESFSTEIAEDKAEHHSSSYAGF